ncbi:MAG TPA: nitroreductase family protein [Acidimicrobiia bacterium]|nr:nitroreductase family protein [Acidimicrobiia bacterium]
MEFKQVIGNRRSIRYFEPDKPVEKAKIQTMLEAANRASRSGNIDYWKALVVYRDELDQDTIDGLRVPTTTAELDMAPVQIYFFADLSYADPDNFRKNLKELVSLGALNPSHGWSDAYVDENVVGQIISPMLSDPQVVGWMGTIETGLAINQAMLAAVDEGLGVCLHAVNMETAKQVFKYPDHWLPCWVLLVGYPAEDPLTGGQRPRRSISTMAYLNNLDTPFEEDPAVTEQLKGSGLIQNEIDAEKRAAEVRQLARRFGLPE